MNHPLITAGGRYPFQKKERKRNNGFTVPEKIAIIYLNPGAPKMDSLPQGSPGKSSEIL